MGNDDHPQGGDSSVVRAPDSSLKGCGFKSLQEEREIFFSSPGSTFCADSYFGICSTKTELVTHVESHASTVSLLKSGK